MNVRRLAEYARMAELGRAADAARACLAEATDADAGLVESAMRYSLTSSDDVDDFHRAHDRAYCVRVPNGEEFWLAPLGAWADLPAGATVLSPRGLRALGCALAEAVAA